MAQKASRKPKNNILSGILLVTMMIGIVVIGIFLSKRGISSLFNENSGSSIPLRISYGDVIYHVGDMISVNGYIIIPHSDTVCFGGWSTCKLWLDDDPTKEGVGKHEVEFTVGNLSDEITVGGVLRGNNGQTIRLTENQSFNWYHVNVIGSVLACKNEDCIIQVQQVKGIQ
jgi:hypothetical protein